MRKELLIAVIITFITICAWVVFDINHARAQVDIPQKLQDMIEPINPNFDTSSIQPTQ